MADTVALVLHLEKRTMGTAVDQAFQDVEQKKAQLLLPAMVFAEIMYLNERKRITATLADVETYLTTQTSCMAAPLTLEIVKAAQTITDIPELHDRLIAATAVHHKATLLTNDTTISASTYLQTLW
ncbi:MAG: PIN domain-containing protein [Caldilineaceae bacterium]|nr:PIN domain-containing protein [Caldilineaceae bacterium]